MAQEGQVTVQLNQGDKAIWPDVDDAEEAPFYYGLALLSGLLGIISLPLWLPVYIVFSVFGLCFPVRLTAWWASNVPGASWQQGDISATQWQTAHGEAPIVTSLPKPGDAVTFDFTVSCNEEIERDKDSGAEQPLRIVTYNVFLGQDLEGVIRQLGRLNPPADVILLQEDNIYTDASVSPCVFRHIGAAVAKALEMAVVFTPAYFRNTPVTGCYGNSILSKKAFESRPVTLPARNRPALVTKMPFMNGHRHFPVASIEFPGWTEPLMFVSAHFPSVGPSSGPIAMLRALVTDVRALKFRTPVVIAGDFNSLPWLMRYLVPFGRTDLYFSCESEQSRMRHEIEKSGLFDPFPDTVGSFWHKFGATKLDWLALDHGRFKVIKKYAQNPLHARGQAESAGSDHMWLLVDVLPS